MSRMLPEHEMIVLPALSPTMETGTIKQWEVNEGGAIEEGDVLCEVETDKAVVAFEAVGIEGYLAKIIAPDGTKDIQVGHNVCIVVENEEDVAAFKNWTPDQAISTPSPAAAPSAPASTQAPPAAQPAGNWPDHEVIALPALSPTMESGTLSSWGIAVGDEIIEGETAIAEIETDKAVVTFEATGIEGYVAKIFRAEGDKDIKLGEPLFIVVEEKEDVAKFADFTIADASGAGASPVAAAPAAAAAAPVAAAAAVTGAAVASGDRVFISPLAKKIAGEQGINVDQLAGTGTGPKGRVVAADVKNFTPAAAAAPVAAAPSPVAAASAPAASVASTGEYTAIDVTNMRRTIAKRLTASKNTIPHYYLTRAINMDNVLQLRKELNSISDSKISVNDFIIKAASLACLKVPECNSAWMGDTIRQYNVVDMCVAVATPTGLMTPIVVDAHAKGLSQISSDVKSLATKAKDGKLQPHEFMGGTFTISNLGMMGIDHFTAIINPPQACILAIGASTQKVILDDSTEMGFRAMTEMKVTLSSDHRVVDGAVGAQWLKAFAGFLEQPITMHL